MSEGRWKHEFIVAFEALMRADGYKDEPSLRAMARGYAETAWLERAEDSPPDREARALFDALGDLADAA